MAFSLESRVPFLDHRLVEKTLALQAHEVIKNGITKSILRKAMKNIIPEKIYLRKDDIGFSTPEDEWLRTPKFQAFIKGILSSNRLRERNIIDETKALNLYNKHINGSKNVSQEIWKIINLELWFREFID